MKKIYVLYLPGNKDSIVHEVSNKYKGVTLCGRPVRSHCAEISEFDKQKLCRSCLATSTIDRDSEEWNNLEIIRLIENEDRLNKKKWSDRLSRLWGIGCLRTLSPQFISAFTLPSYDKIVSYMENLVDNEKVFQKKLLERYQQYKGWIEENNLKDYFFQASFNGDIIGRAFILFIQMLVKTPYRRTFGLVFDSANMLRHIFNTFFSQKAVFNSPINNLDFKPKSLTSKIMADLFRDVFYQPTNTWNSSWNTSTVVTLANTMYNSRNFDLMPILGDALQDADCDDEVVLTHCRSKKPHCRGNWVVDQIRGYR